MTVVNMKYRISPSYYSDSQHPLITAWLSQEECVHRPGKLEFLNWLIRESGSDRVWGNFEDGWSIEFEDEAKYTWFLLKWS
jgi:hypothetical protein